MEVALEAGHDAIAGSDGPIGGHLFQFDRSSGDVAPAVELVFANGPVDHGDGTEIEALADGERVEGALEFGLALDEALNIFGLAAFVIDDDAVVGETVDAVDAASGGNAAGQVENQFDFGLGIVGMPFLGGADFVGDFAIADPFHFEAVTGWEAVFMAGGFERFFVEFDEVAMLAGLPFFEGLMEDGAGDFRLQAFAGTFGCGLKTQGSAGEEFKAALRQIFEAGEADGLMEATELGEQRGCGDGRGYGAQRCGSRFRFGAAAGDRVGKIVEPARPGNTFAGGVVRGIAED